MKVVLRFIRMEKRYISELPEEIYSFIIAWILGISFIA